jgi:hypothetical protein
VSLAGGQADPQLVGAYREFLHFAWDLSPAFAARAQDVREGSGFYRTDLRDGRAFAWARQGAALLVLVPGAGDYALRGDLWLRPGETVTLRRGGALLARVTRDGGDEEGQEPFTAPLPGLPAGRTELELSSNLPERDVGGLRDRKAVAFGLFVPALTRAGR